jgi:hypothetical protein
VQRTAHVVSATPARALGRPQAVVVIAPGIHELEKFAGTDRVTAELEFGHLDPLGRALVVPAVGVIARAEPRFGGRYPHEASGYGRRVDGRLCAVLEQPEPTEHAYGSHDLGMLALVVGKKAEHVAAREQRTFLREVRFLENRQCALAHARRVSLEPRTVGQARAAGVLLRVERIEDGVELSDNRRLAGHTPQNPALFLPGDVPEMPAERRKIGIELRS